MKELINYGRPNSIVSDRLYSVFLDDEVLPNRWERRSSFIASLAVHYSCYVWFCLIQTFLRLLFFQITFQLSILLDLVAFFTWFAFYQAAENDKRIEQGLGPIEGTPENREKVWCWQTLFTQNFL